MFKKKDLFLYVSLFIVVILSFSLWFFSKSGSAANVNIEIDNKPYMSVSLFEDKTIELEGNTVIIKNSCVWVESANCKNQICVNHKPISKKGENIICLPNKVVIKIE